MIFKQNKAYISEIDRFLAEFDAAHPEPSASQRAEIRKHQKIADRRDQVEARATVDPFDF